MLPFKDGETLSRLYHLNSEPWLNAEAYNDPFPGHRIRPPDRPDDVIVLPRTDSPTPLRSLLQRRGSCRRYAAREMPLSTLASLLETSLGGGQIRPAAGGVTLPSRPFPSAGGLYPLDYRLVVTNVGGIRDGLYRYDVVQHRLEPQLARATRADLDACFLAQQFLQDANVLLLLCATFAR